MFSNEIISYTCTKKKKFLLMKKISYSCPKKLISSYRKTFAATAQNKVKNINPQPLEVVIYILQVIKIMFHTILMKKLYTTRLF